MPKPISELSDREIDALVAEHCDGWQWVAGAYKDGTPCRVLFDRAFSEKMLSDGLRIASMDEEPTSYATDGVPRYTASFDEALCALRGMDEQSRNQALLNIEALDWSASEFAMYVEPRDICEAMLSAVGVTEGGE